MKRISLRYCVFGLSAMLGGCAVAPPPSGNVNANVNANANDNASANANANANDNAAETLTRFAADIDAGQEVDTVDSPATGSATLVLNAAQTELTYDIHVSGLTSAVTVAHFHHAPAGQNGAINFDLSASIVSNEDGSARIMGVWSTIGPEDVEDLLAEGLYVNIHTANFPGGEARGQIIPLVPIEME